MVKARKALVSALLMALVALSGCTEGGTDAALVDGAGDLAEGLGDEGELTIDSEVPAPTWTVGQYFGHHLYFTGGPTEGTHINTVVLSDDGSSYHLATDNQEIAELHAIFDFPILGDLNKQDLSTTSFGGPFGGYAFPLFDGKTWSSEITVETTQTNDPITRDVEMSALFNPAIELPGSSKTAPGFDIQALHDGKVLFDTNFVPEIGWYASFQYYNVDGDDPEEVRLFVRSMGYGDDYANDIGGVVYDTSAIQHVNHAEFNIAPEGGLGAVSRTPFEISEDSSKIMGILYAFSAVAGHSQTRLIDPDGGIHGPMALIIPDGADPLTWGAGDGNLYEFPHIVGEWQYTHASAGFVSGGGGMVWELFENQVIL